MKILATTGMGLLLLGLAACTTSPTDPGSISLCGFIACGPLGPVQVPTTIALSPRAFSFSDLGETRQLIATVRDQNGALAPLRGITWSSSNALVAIVSSTGLVAATGKGMATITAAIFPDLSATVEVTVMPVNTVTDLAIEAVTDSSVTLTWTEVLDGTGNPAEYEVRFSRSPIGARTGDLPVGGSCTGMVAGTSVGATAQCDVQGLRLGTAYDFVVAATWPRVGGSRVFGTPSAATTGYTDFVEDFSALADDVVPTPPHDGFTYTTSDAGSDISVRVAAASGQLTDRPLVLAKSGSVSAGGPNFYIERPGLAPLVDTDTGLIHLSMDVQVNSGSFCQFLTVRAPNSTPVAVYLHDLSYTPGVDFRVVITMDVEAGTISAKQDGAAVPISATNFPYLPVRFGLEGCTQLAQEEAIDNIRIELRNP